MIKTQRHKGTKTQSLKACRVLSLLLNNSYLEGCQHATDRMDIKIFFYFLPLCLCAFVALFLSVSIVNAEIFIWEDKEGNKYFADDYSKVPLEYRDTIVIKEMKEDSDSTDNAAPEEPVVTDVVEEAVPDKNDKKTEGQPVKVINIKPEPDKKGNIIFRGEVKNSGTVVVSYIVMEINLIIGKNRSSSLIVNPINTRDNILRPGEGASFFFETAIPFAEVNSFTYAVRWKNFN